MSEKTLLLRTRAEKRTSVIRNCVIVFAAALIMELGGSALSAAPCAAALAAALDGMELIAAFAGGTTGALLHGLPEGFVGAGALCIVLAARVIPDLGKRGLRIAKRVISVVGAVFFSKISAAADAAEVLTVVIAAVSSGAFTLCLCLLLDTSRKSPVRRDFLLWLSDAEGTPAVLRCAVTGAAFMAFGEFDTGYFNIGRVLLGASVLILTSRRSVSSGAAMGAAALCGLCLSGAGSQIASGAAVTAAAACASSLFSKQSRTVRSVGYVFLCAAGILLCGNDEGGYRLLLEAVISGILFTALPLNRLRVRESAFSDKGVGAMINERLSYAAEAIAGVGSGITAAAEVLDKKYSLSPEDIPDRAADRACRSCPQSMTCWGKYYEMFHGEFERLTAQLRAGYDLTEFSVSPECAEICVDRINVVKAIKAEYSRYVQAAADGRRVRELRRIYTDELSGVRDILRDMGLFSADISGRNTAAEERIENILKEHGADKPRAFVTRDCGGKLRVEAYSRSAPRLTREQLGTLLMKAVGRDLELPEMSGKARCRITAFERTRLSARIGSFQLAARDNSTSGDCEECFTGADGALYVVLSDGMGAGSRARVDSTMACSVLVTLLKSGITLSSALETVNSVLMVKSADESFATLDICKLDLNTGEGAVYKAGAAVTYIKTGDKLIRAVLSSPPAGTGGRLTVPAQRFRVKKGDVIVMMTDGASVDEQWLSRELSRAVEPDKLSERIAKTARAEENGARDDISVVTIAVDN